MTRRSDTEDSHLHILRRENLKSEDLDADFISVSRLKGSGSGMFGPLHEGVIMCGSLMSAIHSIRFNQIMLVFLYPENEGIKRNFPQSFVLIQNLLL
jgi:hypothetical protein